MGAKRKRRGALRRGWVKLGEQVCATKRRGADVIDASDACFICQSQMGHVAWSHRHLLCAPKATLEHRAVFGWRGVDPAHVAQATRARCLDHGLLAGPDRIKTARTATRPSTLGCIEVQAEFLSLKHPQFFGIDADRAIRGQRAKDQTFAMRHAEIQWQVQRRTRPRGVAQRSQRVVRMPHASQPLGKQPASKKRVSPCSCVLPAADFSPAQIRQLSKPLGFEHRRWNEVGGDQNRYGHGGGA